VLVVLVVILISLFFY